MRIALVGLMVDDQVEAKRFYTEVLGFRVKHDIDMGGPRWLTLLAPDGPLEVELLLEPNTNEAGRTFQRALYAQGIPATSFASVDVRAEHARLVARGVVFATEPKDVGGTVIARFDDTCGNWIQLHQQVG